MAKFSFILFTISVFQAFIVANSLRHWIGEQVLDYEISALLRSNPKALSGNQESDDDQALNQASIWIVACSDETCPTNFCHPERQICGCNDDSDCNFDDSFVEDDICLHPRNSTAPGICAAMFCALIVDRNHDGFIDEDDLLADFQIHLTNAKNMTIPEIEGLREEELLVVRNIIARRDEDSDKKLDMTECVNIAIDGEDGGVTDPIDVTEFCMKKDLNGDGDLTTTEIIQYEEENNVDPWACCPTEGCQTDDKDCQKNTFDKWMQTVVFGNETVPITNVTIEQCVAIFQTKETISLCGGC